MKDNLKIEEGDTIDVRFERIESISSATVLHVPCATGDSWELMTPSGVVYVQLFGRMDLIKKGSLI